jgi:hypothetical protein
MKNYIFWDITPQVATPATFMLVSCVVYSLTLKMEVGLHGIISQKTEVFMTTAVRT